MGIDAWLRIGRHEKTLTPPPRPIRRPVHGPKLIARHSIPGLVPLIGRLVEVGMATEAARVASGPPSGDGGEPAACTVESTASWRRTTLSAPFEPVPAARRRTSPDGRRSKPAAGRS